MDESIFWLGKCLWHFPEGMSWLYFCLGMGSLMLGILFLIWIDSFTAFVEIIDEYIWHWEENMKRRSFREKEE